MKLFEIEIGRTYKCDCRDGQYFGTVKQKQDGQIGVSLGNKVGSAAPVDPIGRPELVWLAPNRVHPLRLSAAPPSTSLLSRRQLHQAHGAQRIAEGNFCAGAGVRDER
jgi:hypothetical protein